MGGAASLALLAARLLVAAVKVVGLAAGLGREELGRLRGVGG